MSKEKIKVSRSFSHLLEQKRGSSLPSPQSSMLSQNFSAETHLRLLHVNSLIWQSRIGSLDCLMLRIDVTPATKMQIAIMKTRFRSIVGFRSVWSVCLHSSSGFRWDSQCPREDDTCLLSSSLLTHQVSPYALKSILLRPSWTLHSIMMLNNWT